MTPAIEGHGHEEPISARLAPTLFLAVPGEREIDQSCAYELEEPQRPVFKRLP